MILVGDYCFQIENTTLAYPLILQMDYSATCGSQRGNVKQTHRNQTEKQNKTEQLRKASYSETVTV